MKHIKKVLSLMIASLCLFGCTNKPIQEEVECGGWAVPSDPTVSQELREKLDKELNDVDGVSYNPVKILEQQVVAGMNYRILCDRTVTSNPVRQEQVIITIYEDLDGHIEVSYISSPQ